MADLINYLADNEGEIHSMKTKRFYQHATRRDLLELALAEPEREVYTACMCGASILVGIGPLCVTCDADESDALVQSFHQAWEYPRSYRKQDALIKKWGRLGVGPAYSIGVG
jgi:hypothetical protein